MFKKLFLSGLPLLLSACSVIQLNPDAAHVQFTSVSDTLNQCEYRGEIIGSEGHWYTYLFIANEDLMQAALNDMRNQAAAKGANTVYLEEPYVFGASVTILGLAYSCDKNR